MDLKGGGGVWKVYVLCESSNRQYDILCVSAIEGGMGVALVWDASNYEHNILP